VIRVQRVYELSGEEPGARWLVDRRWPRGVRREALQLAGWAREAAPSEELRRWFGHEPERWEEFRRRYVAELDAAPDSWRPLQDAARASDLLLLYGARDREHNNAVVLRDYLLRQGPLLTLDEQGGESACWLDRVCPHCGRLVEGPSGNSGSCPACGKPLVE
jgi:uncharacterized protein YeaO (DUF488 family)